MKHIRFFCTGLLVGGATLLLQAQQAMTVDDLVNWKRITSQTISNNGQWAACVFSPWRGDAQVEIYSATDGKQIASFAPATEVRFSSSSDYAVVKTVPFLQLTDSLKLKKTPKEKMPMPVLKIVHMADQKETVIDSLKSYKMAETGDWLAYQAGRKDSALTVMSLDGNRTISLPNVLEYGFSRKGEQLYFVTKDSSATFTPGIYRWSTDLEQAVLVKAGKGTFKQVVFSENGQKLAFVYTEKNGDNEQKSGIWLADSKNRAQQLVNSQQPGMYKGWIVSPDAALRFSKDASRLFFGTSPAPLQKDKHVLPENRPNVQVWSGNEPVQYTVQQYNVKKDLKKSYAAVFLLNENKMIQLADTVLQETLLPSENGEWAIVYTSRPYSLSSMWEGRTRADYYKVSLCTGERSLLKTADYTRYRISPEGRFAYGYNPTDSCWYTYHFSSSRLIKLTSPRNFTAWDEENDVPDYPEAYGIAGWTQGDDRILIYDRYDIWSFDPMGNSKAVNLTVNGRASRRTYRWLNLDKEQHFISLAEPQFLSAFDELRKTTLFYQADLKQPQAPVCLLEETCKMDNLMKAKDANRLLFTKERFDVFPDIYAADINLKKPIQLTQGIRQQKPFVWGTAELLSWVTLDGDTIEGVLYKPEGFDPKRKYPMIVNFYERNSETLHKYRMPEPHRSTIDYHLYLSNGYLVFNPDVRYKVDGFPGEDCYNCVMSGIASLATRGFVDMKHIGAQGHSWGGYQVAYLATRTDLFAAIESGAPVVNMFSAYGGIRWGSGLNRSFQYEHTQSRIGGTPWDAPTRYFENSPLFLMDKVKTPILIMHNDQDGHVPWYQGIEYFIALKRLQKPVWMLNYTGEPHWPLHIANKIDFQKRMFQFFNHYLKGAAQPQWMKEGVPAVKQPYELGY